MLVAAVQLVGCDSAADRDDPGMTKEAPLKLIAFDEVTAEHCLGDTAVRDGKVPTTDCGNEGAFEITGVIAFGEDAPNVMPSPATLGGMATDRCTPTYEDWAKSNGGISLVGLTQVVMYPEQWEGSTTPLVCAIINHEP
jgi:hypothetical protein